MSRTNLPSNSIAIAKQKLRAIETAKRRLSRQLEDIEWRNTELKDQLDSIDELAANGELPDFTVALPRSTKRLK